MPYLEQYVSIARGLCMIFVYKHGSVIDNSFFVTAFRRMITRSFTCVGPRHFSWTNSATDSCLCSPRSTQQLLVLHTSLAYTSFWTCLFFTFIALYFLHLYLSTGSFPELLQLLLVLQQGLSAVICFILLLLSTTISSLRCYLGNINWPYVRSLFMALGNNALRIQTLVHRPLAPFGYEEFFYRYLPWSIIANHYWCGTTSNVMISPSSLLFLTKKLFGDRYPLVFIIQVLEPTESDTSSKAYIAPFCYKNFFITCRNKCLKIE